jgi:hypothetical protein
MLLMAIGTTRSVRDGENCKGNGTRVFEQVAEHFLQMRHKCCAQTLIVDKLSWTGSRRAWSWFVNSSIGWPVAVHKVIRAISGIHNHNDTALVTGTGCGVVLELWRRPMVGEGKLRGDGD